MKNVLMAVSSVALLAVGLFAAEEAAEKFSAKCPVSGKDAIETSSVEYRGALVYFCCEGCPDAFKADTKKYAANANMQLVQTGQATEVKCPFTGGKLNKDTAIKVGDVEVAFCCNNCKAKASEKSGADQVALVFNDTAFEKGFEVKKAEKSE
jgi:YHS domain-containing protein